MSLAKTIRLLCIVAVSLLFPTVALAVNVEPGYELLRSMQPTYHDFSGPFAIPAGFFDPGSDPFEGQVAFTGLPLGAFTPCPGDLGPTDTIVERKDTAFLPGPGSTDTVPIEIVALSLVSVAPITVTYSGSNPEEWDVHWTVSQAAPSTGSMTVRQETGAGGTFDSVFYVRPLIRFTRQSDGMLRTLDGGGTGLQDEFHSYFVPWSYENSGVTCPDCVANFYPGPFMQSALYALHSMVSGCQMATDSEEGSWGRIKVLYR